MIGIIELNNKSGSNSLDLFFTNDSSFETNLKV